jgi:hypothetical protein
MARSYYSVVLDYPADEIWATIRLFDHYAWAGVESDIIIEDNKAGDQVGAVRRVSVGGKAIIRQILLAHSDAERSYTYAFAGECPFPVLDYTATIRVATVAANNRAFVEWWATFDCAEAERDKWVEHFAAKGFALWLASLDRFMADGRTPGRDDSQGKSVGA